MEEPYQRLEKRLHEIGEELESMPQETEPDCLLQLLWKTEDTLERVPQEPSKSTMIALKKMCFALVSEKLMCNGKNDIRVSLSSCLIQIARITAPLHPYGDGMTMNTFRKFLECFTLLSDVDYDPNCPLHLRIVGVFKTFYEVRLHNVMLSWRVESDDLIKQMCGDLSKWKGHSEDVCDAILEIVHVVLFFSPDLAQSINDAYDEARLQALNNGIPKRAWEQDLMDLDKDDEENARKRSRHDVDWATEVEAEAEAKKKLRQKQKQKTEKAKNKALKEGVSQIQE